MRVFAVGDIHGHAETFEALIDRLKLDYGDRLILLGDMINKGPDTMRVLDIILDLKIDYNVCCLRGNHEHRFLRKLNKGKIMDTFVGKQHKKSFPKNKRIQLNHTPPFYERLIKNTIYYTKYGKYIMVHGGLNFKNPDPIQDKKFMMSGRDWYSEIDYQWLGDRIILHGHDPVKYKRIKKLFNNIEENQYLNLDCGIGDRKSKGYGRLIALELTEQKLYFVKRV